MSFIRKKLFLCPNCGSDNIEHMLLKEVYINPNTHEIREEVWVNQFNIGQEPEWSPCLNCGFKFDQPKEIIAVVDSEDKIIYREDSYPEDSELAKLYIILTNFETELRKCIYEKMEKHYGKKWWKEGVPSDVISKAKERMKRELGDTPDIFRRAPIEYFLFSDYYKIITRKDNWQNIFKDVFKDEIKMEVWLREISDIRNKIMHTRKITEIEKKTLLINIEKIKLRL